MDGGPSKELGPGSYAFVAGGPEHPHIIDCKAGAACVYFEKRPGKNDIKYVEGQAPSRLSKGAEPPVSAAAREFR